MSSKGKAAGKSKDSTKITNDNYKTKEHKEAMGFDALLNTFVEEDKQKTTQGKSSLSNNNNNTSKKNIPSSQSSPLKTQNSKNNSSTYMTTTLSSASGKTNTVKHSTHPNKQQNSSQTGKGNFSKNNNKYEPEDDDDEEEEEEEDVDSEEDEENNDDDDDEEVEGHLEDDEYSSDDDDEDNDSDESEDDGESEQEEEEEYTIEGHREALEKLKQKDPKFYASLQRDAPGLLAFGDEDDDEEDDEEDDEAMDTMDQENTNADQEEDEDNDENDETPTTTKKRSKTLRGPEELTYEKAQQIMNSAFQQKSWKGLIQAVHAFRGACYTGDITDVLSRLGLSMDDAADHENNQGKKFNKKQTFIGKDAKSKAKAAAVSQTADVAEARARTLVYQISTPKVFMYVFTEVLTHSSKGLFHHLGKLTTPAHSNNNGTDTVTSSTTLSSTKPTKDNGTNNSTIPSDDTDSILYANYSEFYKVAPLARTILVGITHLLRQSTDTSMLSYLLKAAKDFIPYLTGGGYGQGTRIRKILHSFLSVFGTHESASVRIAAYLRIRQTAIVLPYPTIDLCYKGAYMAYVRGSKFMTESGAANIALTALCVSELYGIDDVTAYQHAFTYLRQLAIHLRTALTTRSKESLINVLSWQFINCLRLCTTVITSHGTDPSRPLFQLVYPLVSILQGLLRLQPSSKYYPLRTHIVGMLNEISWSTNVYIPIMPILVDILRSPLLTAKPHGAAPASPPLLNLMIKVGKTTSDTRSFQDVLVTRIFELLSDGLRIHYNNIAFPEIIIPIITTLRQFAKSTRVAPWRQKTKALIEALLAQGNKIAVKRTSLKVGPSDRIAIASFMQTEGTNLRQDRLAKIENNRKFMIDNARQISEQVANQLVSKHSITSTSKNTIKGKRKYEDEDTTTTTKGSTVNSSTNLGKNDTSSKKSNHNNDDNGNKIVKKLTKSKNTVTVRGLPTVEAKGDIIEDIDFSEDDDEA